MPLALRVALRELRGGLAGFRVFLACLALGVAAIAAVGSVRAAIEAGLAREAAALLGGDAEVEFAYRFADPGRARLDGGDGARRLRDRRLPLAGGGGRRRARRWCRSRPSTAAIRSTARSRLAGGGSLDDALGPRDGLPGIVAERILVDRLGLVPGDTLTLGTRRFRLAGTIEAIPDAGGGALAFGPQVIVRLADLEGSGLLSEGSLFDSSYRLRLAPDADLAALEAEAEARFADRGLQWRDRRDGAPGVGRFVDRLADFLILLGLAGLAVGGIGVASAVRAHLETRTATIATLKTLGATGATVFAVYLIEIGLLALAGVAIGLVLGAALPLLAAPLAGPRLPVPAEFGLYPRPLAEAALYGVLTALVFSLWPLARARDVRPAALFRDEAAPVRGRPRPARRSPPPASRALLVGSAALSRARPG